ncbi:MAG: CocE/NonD family hydrolase [Armatimonadetes bacterium]|nr:CocE/NonD family hydrolase [Armatimonadota bacterium]
MRLAAFAIGLVCLVVMVRAETVKTDVLLGGKPIGSNSYESKPDGSFVSVTKISVSGMTIDSSLTGRTKNGLLAECTIEESIGKQKGRAVWKDGKINGWVGDKQTAKDVPYTEQPKAVFASYHPQLFGSILKAYQEAKDKKALQVFNIGSFTFLKPEFSDRSQTVSLKSGAAVVTFLKGSFAGVAIELAFDASGRTLGMNIPSQNAQFVLSGFEGVFVDPLSLYPELSRPVHLTVRETRVRHKTRDGVHLMSDIERPAGEGKVPTVLVRTPYGRAQSLASYAWLATRGYAVVVEDVRGRGGSDGDWDPFVREKEDGFDTLDWISKQPWSDGKVGMIGGSYLGSVQWAAAASKHPALKCIVPQVSPPDPMSNIPWDNGAFMLLGNVWWTRVVIDRSAGVAGAFEPMKNADSLKALPITKVDDKFFGRDVPFFDSWVRRDARDKWPGPYTQEDVAGVKIPVLHVSGTWDGDGVGTMVHWQLQRASGGDQWMVFGPWEHGFNAKTQFGDVDYGPGSVLEMDSVYLRFFDTYLKDQAVHFERQPRVRMFVSGSNTWLTTKDWPPAGAVKTTLAFGGGKANGTKSAGTLVRVPENPGKDAYVYDPNKSDVPASELAVSSDGATTRLPVDKWGDGVLVYKSSPFPSPTKIGGPVTVDVEFKTTAKDATFHAWVVDFAPNGECRFIELPGTMRATYRDGKLAPIRPGQTYRISVKPWLFCHEFAKGHRLGVLVFSEFFPKFARNPGTGEPDWKATKLVKAGHTVFKGAGRASRVTFYVIP